MGTTLDAIASNAGVRIGYVLAIEGVPHLLTDSADTSAALTAWSGTDWSSCLSGLVVDHDRTQNLQPWEYSFDSGITLRAKVIPDSAADTFGTLVGARASGTGSVIEADVDHDDTTLTVLDASKLSAPSGVPSFGYAYVGPERIRYTTRDTGADTISGATRGHCSPFTTSSGARFSRSHLLADVADGVRLKPLISTVPRQWIGRNVALYMHRISGTVWDTKAEAQLVFAGEIVEISDDVSGATVVEAEDIRARLNRTIIGDQRYRAKLGGDLSVIAGQKITCRERYGNSSPWTDNETVVLTVVESGASGSGELDAGFYTRDQIVAAFNEALADNATLDLDWSCRVDDDGSVVIEVQDGGTYDEVMVFVTTTNRVWDWLGFDQGPAFWRTTTETARRIDDSTVEIRSGANTIAVTDSITTENAAGVWWDNRSWLPRHLRSRTGGSGSWGVIKIGGAPYLAKYVSDTEFSDLTPLDELGNIVQDVSGIEPPSPKNGHVEQVVWIEGSWVDVVARLFASTGTSGFNHATYDEFPAGLGAAVPWSLLGDNFVNSLASLEDARGGMRLIVDDSTKLPELIGSDLLLRGARLVWKNGGLQFAGWATPSSATSTVTLSESNKASAVPGDDQRAPAVETDEYVRNVITFEYSRGFDGRYNRTREYRLVRSINAHGARTAKLKLRNAHDEEAEAAIDAFVKNVLPLWGTPLHKLSRTISYNLFEDVAPGDVATLSDDFVRDPATGARGISGKPCVIVKHSSNFGGDGTDLVGEIEVVYSPFDRVAAYSPTAEVDETESSGTFSAGYDATNLLLRCKQHAHSLSSEAVDASRFEAGDKIRIIEIDPAGGSADSWTRTVVSVSGDDIEIDSALSSPAWDSGKLYRIVSQSYNDATNDQRPNCYQADDGDLEVQNIRDAYEYGRHPVAEAVAAADASEAPERYSTAQYGDGVPLSSADHKALAQGVNWLMGYGCAPQQPLVWGTERSASSIGSADWQVVGVWPIYLGGGNLVPPGQVRKLYVRPIARSTSGGSSGDIRVTLSIFPPTIPDDFNDATFDASAASTSWSTISAGKVLFSEKSIEIPSRDVDRVWLTVEVNQYGATHGLASVRVGPLEDA